MVRRVVPLTVLYLAGMAGGVWAIRAFAIEGAALYAAALVMALPLLASLFAVARYVVEENDEYLRMLFVRNMIAATGILLTVCAVWGLLELVAGAPALPIYYGVAIWCLGFPVGRFVGIGRQ